VHFWELFSGPMGKSSNKPRLSPNLGIGNINNKHTSNYRQQWGLIYGKVEAYPNMGMMWGVFLKQQQ